MKQNEATDPARIRFLRAAAVVQGAYSDSNLIHQLHRTRLRNSHSLAQTRSFRRLAFRFLAMRDLFVDFVAIVTFSPIQDGSFGPM
jgi:hypothetical protein